MYKNLKSNTRAKKVLKRANDKQLNQNENLFCKNASNDVHVRNVGLKIV